MDEGKAIDTAHRQGLALMLRWMRDLFDEAARACDEGEEVAVMTMTRYAIEAADEAEGACRSLCENICGVENEIEGNFEDAIKVGAELVGRLNAMDLLIRTRDEARQGELLTKLRSILPNEFEADDA